MQSVTPLETAAMIRDQGTSVVVLDVREDEELAVASLDGVVHIPMQQIPERLDTLDRSKTIIVMCHAGGRSAMVADFLLQQGFTAIFNMTGGIQRWSEEVDASIPQY